MAYEGESFPHSILMLKRHFPINKIASFWAIGGRDRENDADSMIRKKSTNFSLQFFIQLCRMQFSVKMKNRSQIVLLLSSVMYEPRGSTPQEENVPLGTHSSVPDTQVSAKGTLYAGLYRG